MKIDERKRQRRFHYKNIKPSDPAVRRLGEWSQANLGFYNSFRNWLKETGYSASALGIYSVAARYAIGYLDKAYWIIDPDTDLDRVWERMLERYTRPGTLEGYRKGLLKFGEFIRLRCKLPPKPKQINWGYYTGILPVWLTEDIRDFIRHCQQRWPLQRRHEATLDTVGHLTKSLRWMAKRYPLKDIGDITPEIWFAYVDERLSNEIKPTTINSELSMLRHLLNFLDERGRLVCTRLLLVDYLNEGQTIPKDVPIDQLMVLQEEIQREAVSPNGLNRRMGIMDAAWFLLMLHSGLRTCEIRAMRSADLDWDGRRVRIERSKGLKDRMVYLSQVTLDAIHQYLKVRGPAEALPDYLFVFRHKPISKSYCGQRLRTYSKRCGVKVTPHQLRHSFATLILNAGAPVLSVQMLLGHQYVDTTLKYARLYDGTVAADYYQAMTLIEHQMGLPEDEVAPPPSPGELIAMVDSLREGTLNEDQRATVGRLRAGIMTLAEEAQVRV